MFLYNLLFYLALPVIFLRLLLRSKREPAYRKRWKERLGYYPFSCTQSIWVHAVSVGESLAAVPLIEYLLNQYPDIPIVVTNMTPTGAARIEAVFGIRVKQAYLPYDFPAAVKRFLQAMQPKLAIIIETELWPNIVSACEQRGCPLVLANARLSEQSAKKYHLIPRLTRNMLQQIAMIAAVAQTDAKHFLALGAAPAKVAVTGNLKFDLIIPEQLHQQAAQLREEYGKKRFIWIAASTHEGEEELILAAHQVLLQHSRDALLILVPRHPNRFDQVATLASQKASIRRRQYQEKVTEATSVYLGDTMGELLLLYAVADVACVGGSFIPRGGHNLLEPAALSKPVISGPYLFNFAEISEQLIRADALKIVANSESLAAALLRFADNLELQAAMGKKGWEVVQANRGALGKQIKLIERYLKKK